MPLRRKRETAINYEPRPKPTRPPDELVRIYLRAQNYEHIRQTDDAVPLYEEAVAARFDACGPYDRLIAIYIEREAFDDVKRIAAAALSNVRTFADKRAWYEAMRDNAQGFASDKRGAEF